MHPLAWPTQVSLADVFVSYQIMGESNVLLIEAVVKAYQE